MLLVSVLMIAVLLIMAFFLCCEYLASFLFCSFLQTNKTAVLVVWVLPCASKPTFASMATAMRVPVSYIHASTNTHIHLYTNPFFLHKDEPEGTICKFNGICQAPKVCKWGQCVMGTSTCLSSLSLLLSCFHCSLPSSSVLPLFHLAFLFFHLKPCHSIFSPACRTHFLSHL